MDTPYRSKEMCYYDTSKKLKRNYLKLIRNFRDNKETICAVDNTLET